MNCEICKDTTDTPQQSGGLFVCGECYEIECDFYEELSGDKSLADAAEQWYRDNAP